MLGRHLISRAARSAKNDRDLELPAGHVKHLGGRINNLIRRQNGKIEGHELDNRPQASHRRAYTETGEAKFSDWRIDNSFWSKLREQPARYLVRAVVLRNLFAHQKNVLVASQLFVESLVQGVAHGNNGHLFKCPD